MKPKLLLLTGADKTGLISKFIEKRHDLVAVFVPTSEKYKSKYEPMLKFCAEKKVQLISGKPNELYNKVKSLDVDLLYSCGYPFKVPRSLISKVRYAINFHPTLLPKHRGKYLHWIILDGDEESGVTAHFMDENYDTGPIIAQKKHLVSKFETVASLLRKASDLESLLALELMNQIEQGKELLALRQNEESASNHFGKREPRDSKINPSKTLLELYNEIRVSDPELYPAYFDFEGNRVGIKMFRLNKPDDEFDLL